MAAKGKDEAVELSAAEAELLVEVCGAGEVPYEENKGVALDGLIAHELVTVVDGRTICATEKGEAAGKAAEKAADKPAGRGKEG